jgi:PBSX family phage portal protein
VTTEGDEIEIAYLDIRKASNYGSDDPFKRPVSDISLGRNASRRVQNQIRKRLEGDGAESKQITSDYTSYDALDLATPPYDLKYLAKLYEVSPYNYAAINAKAANVVGLGFEFVETFATKQAVERASSEKKRKTIRQKLDRLRYELTERLESFNDENLFIQIITAAYTDYEATGMGYIEVGRTVNGNIGYLGHIPSLTMRVRNARDGYVQISGNKAVFFRNFGDTTTPDPISDQKQPNEIIVLKKSSPTNSYYGVPDIVSALGAVAGNEFATRFNLDYFEHRAAPRYVITLKGGKFSAATEQRLLEFMQSDLKGKSHRSVIIPLPPDDPSGSKTEFNMQAVENGIQDSSFDNYRTSNRDEILMAHRVPITKIGISDNASVALAKDADKTFKEQVCQPEQRALAKKINRIIREMTDALELEFNELTLTDEDTQSRIDERYLRMQVYTPNEVRLRKGMTPISGGDKVIELKPQQSAEQSTQASGNRKRDQERSATNPDSSGSQPRNAKGEGRQQQ